MFTIESIKKVVYMDSDKLRAKVKEKGTTLKDMSLDIGYNEGYVQKVVSQKDGRISPEGFKLICDYLGVEEDYLKRDIRIIDYGSFIKKLNEMKVVRGDYYEALDDIRELMNNETL